MNIYQVAFTAKKTNANNTFTIVVDAHSKYEGDAIEEAKIHVSKYYSETNIIDVKSVKFIESVESRIKQLEKFQMD